MKVGLIDVDGHNFPNLALMKLSSWHKSKGDIVEKECIGNYDKIYMSKVFTFTGDYNGLINSDCIIKSGTGYKIFDNLPEEIEHIIPDYKLYNCNSAYGFLTRGCIRNCSWCVVPKKEGKLKPNADITEFLGDYKTAILLDNNVLASKWGLSQIEKIIDMKIKIDFNQGLDARIIANNPDIAKLLSKVKWLKYLRMSLDTLQQFDSVEKATILLRKYGCKPSNYYVNILVDNIESSLNRVEFCRKLKLDPFAQPYLDYETGKTTNELKRFSRWVNHKAIFKTVKWKDYN